MCPEALTGGTGEPRSTATGGRTSTEVVSHPPGTGPAVRAAPAPDPAAEPAGGTVPRRRKALVIVAALLIVAGVMTRSWWMHPADIRSGTTAVDARGMAARYGIDVSLIAVTAAGGLVEFRYQVVDPDKADRIVTDRTLAPAFVVEESGETLRMSAPAHHHGAELQLGGTYFFLLANAHNAIHRGSKVTLVIGDARLEHIVAQG